MNVALQIENRVHLYLLQSFTEAHICKQPCVRKQKDINFVNSGCQLYMDLKVNCLVTYQSVIMVSQLGHLVWFRTVSFGACLQCMATQRQEERGVIIPNCRVHRQTILEAGHNW